MKIQVAFLLGSLFYKEGVYLMFEGYSLREYKLGDWLLLLMTSAFALQILLLLFSVQIIQYFPDLFWGELQSEVEVLSELVHFSAVFGTILSLPLTLLVIYQRKIPLFNRKQLTKQESFIVRGLDKDDWKFLVKYIPSSYILFLLGNGLVVMVFGEAEAVNQLAVEGMFESVPVWQMFIMIVVVAPVVEELLFRGLILFSGKQLETTWLRIVISAILFGAIHNPTNIQSIYTYVGMGFIFSYAAKRTQSIEAPIIYHFLNNLIAFGAVLSL